MFCCRVKTETASFWMQELVSTSLEQNYTTQSQFKLNSAKFSFTQLIPITLAVDSFMQLHAASYSFSLTKCEWKWIKLGFCRVLEALKHVQAFIFGYSVSLQVFWSRQDRRSSPVQWAAEHSSTVVVALGSRAEQPVFSLLWMVAHMGCGPVCVMGPCTASQRL